MSRIQHFAISSVPLEDAHGGEGKRRILLQGDAVSPSLEAFANTFLPKGGKFSWHAHEKSDEIMVCRVGKGAIEMENGEVIQFQENDVVYIPKGMKHTISCPEYDTEYFFVRVLA